MKDTLGEVQSKIKELKSDEVLTLVLMKDTLGVCIHHPTIPDR